MQIHSWTENDHQRENVANKVKQEKAENAGASVHGNQRDNESHEAQDRQHMHSSKVTRGKQIVNEHHESFIFLHQLLGYQLRLLEHRLGCQHLQSRYAWSNLSAESAFRLERFLPSVVKSKKSDRPNKSS